MTNEQNLFIHILADYVNGVEVSRYPTQDNAPDSHALFELARIHGCIGIVYVELRNAPGVPADLLKKLHDGFIFEVSSHVRIRETWKKIAGISRDSGIDVVPMKGICLSEFHPEPNLRTMGDLDVIIHPDDREKIRDVLTRQGFTCVNETDPVYTYRYDRYGVETEVHTHPFYRPLLTGYDYAAYFDGLIDKAVPDEQYRAGYLTPSDEFIMLVVHTAKHFSESGCGIRPFLDFCFIDAKADLDWPYIIAELEEMRILPFAKRCYFFCKQWFDYPIPPALAEVPDDDGGVGLTGEFIEYATLKVLSGGVFGFEDADNSLWWTANEMTFQKKTGLSGGLSVLFSRLFIPYKSMIYYPYCGFLKGRPYLLPIAWLVRLFVIVFRKKGKRDMNKISEPFTKQREIQKRQAYLSVWGLGPDVKA